MPHSPSRYRPWVVGIVLAALVLAGCAVYYGTTQKEPASEELDLCRRFMALKNRNDPAANDLLGPAPVAPAEPLAPAEADALHTEFFLRGDYQVVSVGPETADVSGPGARFVLVLHGGLSSPRIPQTGPHGTDVINRVITDPDIIVRVEGNKIRGVSFRRHPDPNEKPLSEEERRRAQKDVEDYQKRLIEFYQGTGRSGGGKP